MSKTQGRKRNLAVLLAVAACVISLFPVRANASQTSPDPEVTEMNQIMTILVDCDARELPERGAEAVVSFSAGDSVWVTGQTEEGWYLVSYQDKQGYIPEDCITNLQIESDGTEIDLTEAGLDEEMTAIEAENAMLIEEAQRQKDEEGRSLIWIVVIVVLVIGIFATGLISVLKKNRRKGKGR